MSSSQIGCNGGMTDYSNLAFENDQWTCSSYNAAGCGCPWFRGEYTCPSGADCTVDCSAQTLGSCELMKINATQATGLTMQCDTVALGCQQTLVYSPLGTDNAAVSFECSGAGSDVCKYSRTYAPGGYSTSMTYDCSATGACTYAKVYDSTGTGDETNEMDLSLTCSSQSSCQYMQLMVTSLNDTSLTCIGEFGCQSLMLDSSMGIGALNLLCTDDDSCNSAEITISDEGDFDYINLDCDANYYGHVL